VTNRIDGCGTGAVEAADEGALLPRQAATSSVIASA
jgi:hypothetical protein